MFFSCCTEAKPECHLIGKNTSRTRASSSGAGTNIGRSAMRETLLKASHGHVIGNEDLELFNRLPASVVIPHSPVQILQCLHVKTLPRHCDRIVAHASFV